LTRAHDEPYLPPGEEEKVDMETGIFNSLGPQVGAGRTLVPEVLNYLPRKDNI
jgi:hypothetical protein